LFREDEFGLLCDFFRRSRLRVVRISPHDSAFELFEESIRSLILGNMRPERSAKDFIGELKEQILYRFQDPFGFFYLSFLLPVEKKENLVVIGPYAEKKLSFEQILEICEKNGCSLQNQNRGKEYFSIIPVFPENSSFFLLLDSFCERMWGKPYRIFDREDAFHFREGTVFSPNRENDLDDTLLDIKNMEQRYVMENEMMDAVAFGAEQRINRFFSDFSGNFFEKRLSDPVRNSKNYCIIMNTLLRKAAERGGVHPVYLHRVSSRFAMKIEQLPSLHSLSDLMREMCSSYCRLVAVHSSKQYSLMIQKVMIAIESDLSAELNLGCLAEKLCVSKGYLSTEFRKATGKTITSYIREKRLSYAKHLFEHTSLQVQTVAQHCGIMDVQYFSKLFKRFTGKTPTEFREENNPIPKTESSIK